MDYLGDVPKNEEFILGHKRINNLYGLLFELREMEEHEYGHYVGENYNYFADWIQHVLKHPDLAESMRQAESKEDLIDVLEKELEKLTSEEEEMEADKEEEEDKGFSVDATSEKDGLIEHIEDMPPEEEEEEELLEDRHEEEKEIAYDKQDEKLIEDMHEEPVKEEAVKDDVTEKKAPEKTKKSKKRPLKDDYTHLTEIEELLKEVAQDEAEVKIFLWKHFKWEMAKEFMYGLAIGILIGFVLAKIFLPV